MILRHLSVINYKNIAEADLELSSNVNCFVGSNGMGKTNVLDAVYFLSFCKSSISGNADALNMKHDADFFFLQGEYESDNNVKELISCGAKRGSRKHLKRNDREYKRLSEHVGVVPLVMISPNDIALVQEGSEERRRFMNGVISQLSMPYLEAVMRYEKTLKQRNSLLRAEAEPDSGVLDALEALMAKDSYIIYKERRDFLEAFQPIFNDLYHTFSPMSEETVDLSLITHADRGDLATLLREGRQKERIIGYSLYGPHRDDLQMTIKGYPIRREGSQGQSKTFVTALKLAQFLYLKERCLSRTPILLLDDIFDKLDAQRVERIVNYVSGNAFGQIFITDTNRKHIDSILAATNREFKLFEVENGVVRMIQQQ